MSGKELTGLAGPEARTGGDLLPGTPSATESDSASVANGRTVRDLLLVLGMHRSGTSALAGTLEKLGMEMGRHLLEPTEDNRKGYFEDTTTVLAQEALFESMGLRWHDPRPLPDGWSATGAADELRDALVGTVEELFATGRLAAVKDPRSCRLVALWLDVAARVQAAPSALLMLRHPNEVAESLHRRDGMSHARAHLLWIRYLLESEHATRGIPRAFVSYDSLLEDWRAEVARIEAFLHVGMPAIMESAAADIDGFLDASLRNHATRESESGRNQTPFEALAVSLYELARSCLSAHSEDRNDEFDALALQFESLAQPYLEAVQDSLCLEVPPQIEIESQALGLDRARVEMALQLAALRELWRPATVARSAGACKLYYREEATGFIESRAVAARPVLESGYQKVEFQLPVGAKVDHVRIDPDEVPGVFAVQSLSVGGKVVGDLGERVTAISELKLPATFTAPLRFAALGEDPYFEIDARDLTRFAAADGVIRVEMKFRAETVASQIGEQVQDFGVGLHRSFQELGRQQHALMDSVKTLGPQVSTIGESVSTVSHAMTAEFAVLHEHRAVKDKLHQDLHRELALVLEALQASQKQLSDETAEMRDQQALLLGWARRRSPGYWWNRILGRNTMKRSG